jgi:hypothetical protein
MKLVQWILDGDVLGCRQDVVRTIPFGPVVYWYKRDVKVVYQIYFRVVGTMVSKKNGNAPIWISEQRRLVNSHLLVVTWWVCNDPALHWWTRLKCSLACCECSLAMSPKRFSTRDHIFDTSYVSNRTF